MFDLRFSNKDNSIDDDCDDTLRHINWTIDFVRNWNKKKTATESNLFFLWVSSLIKITKNNNNNYNPINNSRSSKLRWWWWWSIVKCLDSFFFECYKSFNKVSISILQHKKKTSFNHQGEHQVNVGVENNNEFETLLCSKNKSSRFLILRKMKV